LDNEVNIKKEFPEKMTEKDYVIIEVGHEGIYKLWYLAKEEVKAKEMVSKIKKIVAAKRLRYLQKYKDSYRKRHNAEEAQEAEDTICVQEWDGKKFSCCCEKLGMSPTKQIYF